MQFIYATGQPRNMEFAVANTVSAPPADATVLATCTPEAEVEHLDDHTFAMMSDAEFYSFRALVSRARKLELQRAHSARRPGFSLRRALGNLLSALLVCCALFFAVASADAATFTVTTAADSGAGSLRQAITEANAMPSADTINFNIPAPGVQTIALQSPLPDITAPLTINGYTQPGAKPNTLPVGTNAVILIRLDGSAAGSVSGLTVNADVCTIQGLNITRFNHGVEVYSDFNTVAGNFIGVDSLGKAKEGKVSFGNDFSGVLIFDGNHNLVGGSSPAARNLISNNGGAGVHVMGTSVETHIQGNLIGTNASVTARLPNYYGIFLDAAHTTVGGTAPGTGNVISGTVGVNTLGNTSDYTTVQGNFIGTDPTGTRDLGCASVGVSIDADGAIIGGTQSTARNLIAFNSTGIFISPDAQSARILGNSIYDNLGVGIHLGNKSVTSNDPGDADIGANNLQNFPVITSAVNNANGNTTINATLNSEPNKSYRIEFFASPACDDSGYGEGRTYLGSTSASTNNSGNTSPLSVTMSETVSVGSFVTATATNSNSNETSGFSFCTQVTGQAVTQTSFVIEDTYVKGATPTDNFGAATILQVKRTLNPGSGKGRQAYLRFDTSNYVGNVGKATLRVYGKLNAVTAENQNIPLAVFPLSDAAWTEHTLAWANKPAPNVPQPLAQVVVTDDTAQWYEFDITNFINAERAAGRMVTGVIFRNMAKSGTGDFFTQFNSKEAALNKPQLVLAP